MNKAELVSLVAKDATLKKADAELMLNSLIDNIMKAVKKGEDVRLVGFGTFYRGRRKARTGRNPQTGETIKIAACKVPKFRPGKYFRQSLD